MSYLIIGAFVLALIFWGGKRARPRREWRFISAMTALVAFAGAAYAGVRNAWGVAIILVLAGLWLLVTTRASTERRKPAVASGLTRAEACSLLGVTSDATADEVREAYTRLMRVAHPDKGGTAGLAAQLNAARERLLNS